MRGASASREVRGAGCIELQGASCGVRAVVSELRGAIALICGS
jgi:hypothetical protein